MFLFFKVTHRCPSLHKTVTLCSYNEHSSVWIATFLCSCVQVRIGGIAPVPIWRAMLGNFVTKTVGLVFGKLCGPYTQIMFELRAFENTHLKCTYLGPFTHFYERRPWWCNCSRKHSSQHTDGHPIYARIVSFSDAAAVFDMDLEWRERLRIADTQNTCIPNSNCLQISVLEPQSRMKR